MKSVMSAPVVPVPCSWPSSASKSAGLALLLGRMCAPARPAMGPCTTSLKAWYTHRFPGAAAGSAAVPEQLVGDTALNSKFIGCPIEFGDVFLGAFRVDVVHFFSAECASEGNHERDRGFYRAVFLGSQDAP